MPLQTGPGQTSYSLNPPRAVAGMLRRNDEAVLIRSFVCSEDIPFGSVVELVSGQIRRPQTASAIGKIQGVAMFSDAKEAYSGGWKSGDRVPVVLQGTVWVPYTGTAPSSTTLTDWVTSFNVYSSSTIATNRGKVTLTATSASAGVEIYALPNGFASEFTDTVEGLCLVVLNLPA